MKLLIYCLAFLAPTLAFAQKNSNNPTKLKKSAFNNALIDSFENDIKKDIANKLISGGSYLLYEKGKVIASNAIGVSDINTKAPLKRTDIFRMASMTKPLTSLALLLLQEDGLINMNDQLDKYLPAFSQPVVLDHIDTLKGRIVLRTHPAKNAILLRNLLTHTSGFASAFYPKQQALYMAALGDQDKYNLEHFANELSKLPLDFEPGENWQYGPSINVAARVIEVVSGMSFNDFLNKRIIEPMQLKDTKFYLDAVDAPRLTTLYTLDSTGSIVLVDSGNASSDLISGPKLFYSGSGGINSTIDDYLRFCVMILKNGVYENKIIAKPETIALMKTDQVPLNINAGFQMPSGKPYSGFTFGYQIVREEDASWPLTKNTISWAGSHGTVFFIDPTREAIGIYLTQNDAYIQVPSWMNFYFLMTKALKK